MMVDHLRENIHTGKTMWFKLEEKKNAPIWVNLATIHQTQLPDEIKATMFQLLFPSLLIVSSSFASLRAYPA